MAVWRRARRDFTFKGTSYRAGQVFQVPAIISVQMRNRVDKAKAPAEPEPTPAPPKRRGRPPKVATVPIGAENIRDESRVIPPPTTDIPAAEPVPAEPIEIPIRAESEP